MRRSEIFIAHAKLDDFAESARVDLPVSEVERAEQFRMPRRRQEFLGGRILLRRLLARVTGRSSHEIVTADSGKPFCVDGPAISIAHSADTVVCAVTDDGETGIDVELPTRPRDAAKIARRFFTDEEAKWIAEDPDDRFLTLWVIKEAWLKATGDGIPGGLDSLQCTVTPPGILARVHGDVGANLSVYRLENAFVGLATTSTPHESVITYRWDPQANDLIDDSALRLIAATGMRGR